VVIPYIHSARDSLSPQVAASSTHAPPHAARATRVDCARGGVLSPPRLGKNETVARRVATQPPRARPVERSCASAGRPRRRPRCAPPPPAANQATDARPFHGPIRGVALDPAMSREPTPPTAHARVKCRVPRRHQRVATAPMRHGAVRLGSAPAVLRMHTDTRDTPKRLGTRVTPYSLVSWTCA